MIFQVAAVCIGVGILLEITSRSEKMNAEVLDGATRMEDLKGLEEFLERKPLSRYVVVFGSVGSTSIVENSRSGTLAVFVKKTASLRIQRMNELPEYESKVVNLKEVPWYLDDGTARVNVRNYQNARGFLSVLKSYSFTEPAIKHFASLVLSMKHCECCQHDLKIGSPLTIVGKNPDDNPSCECCEHVLEIGSPLTIVGEAERDKDGTPMIGKVYQFFSERIELNQVVVNLESCSVCYEKYSLFLTAMGVVLLAVGVLQNDLSDIKEKISQ